jgi:UDP-glucose 4-epimerase
MGFDNADFRNSPMIRLRVLQNHVDAGRLDNRLTWQSQRAAA